MLRTLSFLAVFLLLINLVASAYEDRSIAIRKKSASGERRVALIIGNNTYQDAPLKNPANDADAISHVLRIAGFDVILVKNASRIKMYSAIKEFSRKLKKCDVGLFYFAGHGVQVDSANYLIPVDLIGTNLQDAEDLRYMAVPLNEVMDHMREPSTQNIIILDACRDNPFLASLSRGTSRGLAKVITPASTSILYSTDPGNTASDGVGGDNGVFTKRLVESIQKNGLELVDVMREVALNVSHDTNGTQHPVFDGVLPYKFYFHTPETVVSATPLAEPLSSAITVNSKVLELRYWESTEKSGSSTAYQSYLNRYPSGDFADLARDRLEQNLKKQKDTKQVEANRLAREKADSDRAAREKAERDELDHRIQEAEARARKAEELSKQNEKRLAGNPQLMASVTSAHVEEKKVQLEHFTATELTMQDNKSGLMWVRNGELSGNIFFRATASFIDKLNMSKYAGYNDWRLPTKKEVETLISLAIQNGWGDKDGHYVSDYLLLNGFDKIKAEYYLIDEIEYSNFNALRMWDGSFELVQNILHFNQYICFVLPVRGTFK
ncbi:MAG: caspase family protein [Desulfuromonadaceae bacterium]|nr:caspase family protein [Desulfuromonadaceae bacterium]MDD2856452.1 caspase family protein [Desulfuromonadaceae bacterium]